MSQFKYLFQPIKLRSVEIPNRIMTESHTTNLTIDHVIDDRYIAYQRERAKGGVGLIVAEMQSVNPNSNYYGGVSFGFDRSRVVPQFKKLSAAVHPYGTKLFAQIWHGGRQADPEASRKVLWSASSIPCSVVREAPKEMEIEDIEEVTRNFGAVAQNLLEGGVDGLTLHGGHGYLICQFLSSFSNKRTDEYGGDLKNRMRFLLGVVNEIRRVNGDAFPLGIRISADEFVEGGLTLEETSPIVKILEETGKVDFISVSCANASTRYLSVPNSDWPPGFLEPLAAGIRQSTNLPVACVGRINDPVLAERILGEGHADLIVMVRALIADPELPRKTLAGKLEDIRPCVGCEQGCLGRMSKQLPITCVHNPAAGREQELGPEALKPAEKAKRIHVIGGGPAGMKLAEMAAARGHRVTLWEADAELGGQVKLAAKMPRRQEWGEIAAYLIKRINKLPVEVRLNKKATAESILQESPDAVVIATGSQPMLPPIPGIERKNVFTIEGVLKEGNWEQLGDSVLIYDRWDGHYKATAPGDFLSEMGKRVTLLTPQMYVGASLEAQNLIPLYQRLLKKGVRLLPMLNLVEIQDRKVVVKNIFSEEQSEIEGIDSVLLCAGNKVNDHLYVALKGKVKELYRVGDCVAPRRVISAITDGLELGLRI